MSRRGLSNRQNVRFGGLIAVLGGREPYDYIWLDLLERGLVRKDDQGIHLTEDGLNEKNRLATLAGLMFEKYNTKPPK